MIVGFLIFRNGTQKLFGYLPSGNAQRELSGLFIRWTAFVLSGMMAVAYFMVFISKSFLPLVKSGRISGVLLCISVPLFQGRRNFEYR